MEPLSLALMAAAAGKVVDSLLGDKANKLVSSVVGGVIGNQADDLVRHAVRTSWAFFQNLRTENPALNHDLERGTREAYLLATLELLRQAEERVHQSSSRLLTAADAEALVALRRGAETDLRDLSNTLPEPIHDAHLFLVDPDLAPTARLARMRQALRSNLDRDAARWLGGGRIPSIVETLLESGWSIDTSFRKNVPRDWHSLIALAFVEKLKTTPRLATVFESKMLAEIAAREPSATPIATFAGFTAQMDVLTVPLQRIEDTLGVIGRDVGDIKAGVQDIKGGIEGLDKTLRGAIEPRTHTVLRSIAATVVVLIVVGGALAYWASSKLRGLDRDYRRLGWVTLLASSEGTDDSVIRVRGQLWLLAQGVAFRDVSLTTVAQGRDGRTEHAEHATAQQAGAGGVAFIDFQIPPGTDRLTACLAIPNPGLNERSRVTQTFSVPRITDPNVPASLTPIADPVVSMDAGGICQPES